MRYLKCYQRRIFLSYSHKDAEIANKIALALENEGHAVFFDKSDMNAGDPFHQRIRSEIASSDIFIVLLSEHSLDKGSYVQTEMGLARERWKSPARRILPVIVDPKVHPNTLDAYLQSVHVASMGGDTVAETVGSVARHASLRVSCWLLLAALAGILVTALAYLLLNPASWTEYALAPLEQVDFRPVADPRKPGSSWVESRFVVSILPVSYTHGKGVAVKIVAEWIDLTIENKTYRLNWLNFSNLKANGCDPDWLCATESAGPQTLSTNSTIKRDTTFEFGQDSFLTWDKFYESVMRDDNKDLTVRLHSAVSITLLEKTQSEDKTSVCNVDLEKLRRSITAIGYTSDAPPPTRIAVNCEPVVQ